ncbi:MAG: hypothetical protein ABIO02_01720 [Patescibacteria group bacterium]
MAHPIDLTNIQQEIAELLAEKLIKSELTENEARQIASSVLEIIPEDIQSVSDWQLILKNVSNVHSCLSSVIMKYTQALEAQHNKAAMNEIAAKINTYLSGQPN